MDILSKTLPDVGTVGFHGLHLQDMKAVGKKITESSPKNSSKKDHFEEENNGGMTERSWNSPWLMRWLRCQSRTVPLLTSTSATGVANPGRFSCENLENRNPYILLRAGSLSHLSELRAAFHVCSLDYLYSTLLVDVYQAVSAADVTTVSTSAMAIFCLHSSNDRKILLFDRSHRLKALRQLYLKN